METRYNLRGSKECHIPVQLASDAEFLAASRESLDPQHSGQVFSGQSDSGTDIDISGLLDISNQDLSFSDSDSVNHGTAVGGNGGPKASGSNPVHVDQNMINQQILAQLNVLGNRLNSIEKNSLQSTGKKTNDTSKIKRSKCDSKAHVPCNRDQVTGMATPSIPAVGNHEAKSQEEVQARLKHLVDNAKPGKDRIKSQRGGSVEVLVANRVKWPHEYVLSGHTKDRIMYNQLSPLQWMAGFCRTIREESDPKNKEFMLDYAINLLDDATDFSWASAKACHAVLLCRME